ncbi:MAG: helix-turn-helix domain-containing protein [Clostridia bacterium]|nr:helix-turn-helix domain-containing protein [Clostridia bacterium]
MAKGQKIGEKQIEVMRAYLAAGTSLAETARKMGLPKSTVATWKKRFEEEKPAAADDLDLEQARPQKGAGARALGEGQTQGQSFEELRTLNQERFIAEAGDIVSMSQQLMRHDLAYAIEHRAKIDRAIEVLCALGERISPQELKLCVKVLTELKLPDIGKLSSVMGTMYDKRALAKGEPTENIGGTAIIKFEDM